MSHVEEEFVGPAGRVDGPRLLSPLAAYLSIMRAPRRSACSPGDVLKIPNRNIVPVTAKRAEDETGWPKQHETTHNEDKGRDGMEPQPVTNEHRVEQIVDATN